MNRRQRLTHIAITIAIFMAIAAGEAIAGNYEFAWYALAGTAGVAVGTWASTRIRDRRRKNREIR